MRNSGQLTMPLPPNFPTMTPKMIGVLGGLDLHGSPRRITWTRLASSAAAGQNSIILRAPVDWLVNDEIIITTTDKNIAHTERHRIALNVNGTVIRTVAPLAYQHIVMRETLDNGQEISVAPAIGLLTRNVRVINQPSGSSQSGVRILVTKYETTSRYAIDNGWSNTSFQGYARLSNTQFIGFGEFDDSNNRDQRSGVFLDNLGNTDPQRSNFISGCSFDGGFNAA